MTTTLDEKYRDDLVLALRLRDVPGPRIGEVLAEIESHVAETGEDPREAFGEPRAYAQQVAEALDPDAPRGRWQVWWSVLRSFGRELGWFDVLVTLVTFPAASLLADGVRRLGAGDDGVLGTPAGVQVVLALLTLGGVALAIARKRGDEADPVVDPRTGRNMLPLRRRDLVPLVALSLALLAGMYLLGWLLRDV